MQVRTLYNLPVWILMWSTANIEPSQYYYFAGAILILILAQLNTTLPKVEKELLSAARAYEWYRCFAAQSRETPLSVINTLLRHV